MSQRCLAPSPGLVTDPLLAALSPDFDSSWGLAPNTGRLRLCAQPHTANSTVNTHALVFTVGLETLPVTVDHAIVLAADSHHVCQRGMTSRNIL